MKISQENIFRKLMSINLIVIAIFLFVFYGSNLIFSQRCQDYVSFLSADQKQSNKQDTSLVIFACSASNFLSFPSFAFYDLAVEAAKFISGIQTSDPMAYISGMATDNSQKVHARFNDLPKGMSFYYEPNTKQNAGYVLLSGGDPKKIGEPFIELWDLNTQKMLHSWSFDTKSILKSLDASGNKNSIYFLHPLLLEDGDLLVSDVAQEGRLVKFDLDGKISAINNKFKFHHSIERDDAGNIYAVATFQDTQSEEDSGEAIVVLNDELEVKQVISLNFIFKSAGLHPRVFSNGSNDPTHMNDIQPLLNGHSSNILFLSLRNTSSIIAYDILEERIIWILDGFTSNQHDVDIMNSDGTAISIFDNNVDLLTGLSLGNRLLQISNLPSYKQYQRNQNTFSLFSPKSLSTQTQKLIIEEINFSKVESRLRPKTVTGGLGEKILASNSLMIEESNYGRLFEYDIHEDKFLWQYINRSDGISPTYFRLSWSRRLEHVPEQFLKN